MWLMINILILKTPTFNDSVKVQEQIIGIYAKCFQSGDASLLLSGGFTCVCAMFCTKKQKKGNNYLDKVMLESA